MADIANSVIQGAQQTAQSGGQTVGDALHAYQVVSQAQNARQQLEIQKEENERNKANWATSQISAIANMPPSTQKIAAKSFVQQAQKLYPGFDPGIADAMTSDSEFTKGLARVFASQNGQNPDVVSNVFGSSLPTLQSHIEHTMQQDAMIKSSQLKSDWQGQRVDEQKNQNAAAAGNHFNSDPIIKNSRQNLNSLQKSSSILDKDNGPVTTKDLNLAYNDYINATAPGGAATEGKVNRELPDTWAQEWNAFKQKVGDTEDLRKSKAGQALIAQLKSNISNVKTDMNAQILGQGQNIAQSYSANTNPRVQATVKGQLDALQKAHGIPAPAAAAGQAQGQAAPAAAAPAGGALLSPQDWLKSQGGK